MTDSEKREFVQKMKEYEEQKKRDEIIKEAKATLANNFLSDITNENNYNQLNDFCKKYQTNCFLMKGKDFVMFPNDYKLNDHNFDKR